MIINPNATYPLIKGRKSSLMLPNAGYVPPAPSFPVAPVSHLNMWETYDSNAYLVDKMITAYVPVRNTYGAGEMRHDGSIVNPAATRFAVDGPLGAGTATTLVFGATTHTWQMVGPTNTYDLENGVQYQVEWCLGTASGTGSKNYRIGQTGTINVNYKTVVVPDVSAGNFSTPDAAYVHSFVFTYDATKAVQLLPDTTGDAATLHMGYQRIRKVSDPAFVAIGSQQWGGVASRGTRSAGGIVLSGDAFNMLGSGGAADGLINHLPNYPNTTSFPGMTRFVVVRVNGGAITGTTGMIVSDDFDASVVPAGTNLISSIAIDNAATTQEGGIVVNPNHSTSEGPGANLIGRGYNVIWQRIGVGIHEWGINYNAYKDRSTSFSGKTMRSERIGSYTGSRLITMASGRNDYEILSKVTMNSLLTQEQCFDSVDKIIYDIEQRGVESFGDMESISNVGDSNDVRTTGYWTFLITGNGYMTPEQNVWLDNQAVGGKGLYDGVVASFIIGSGRDDFVGQLNYLLPGITKSVAKGIPQAVGVRGFTNDSPWIALNRQRVWDEYVQYIYAPILATGADLLLMDVLPCADRFPTNDHIWLRSQQAAYAAANPGRVWHYDSGNTGIFDQASADVTGGGGAHTKWYLLPDYVHLNNADYGDIVTYPGTTGGHGQLAAAYKTLFNTWRAQR